MSVRAVNVGSLVPEVCDEPGANKRWAALSVICLGVLMIVVNTTSVNVAVPTIRDDLKLSQSELAWIANSYMLTFAAFILLGARLGDRFGHRVTFLVGIVLFTVASALCGATSHWGLLIAGRALQGVGGAVVPGVALSMIMNLFTDEVERAKAISGYSFVSAAGGGLGLIVGGSLTALLSWHSIFLLNVLLGMAVCVLGSMLMPRAGSRKGASRVDVVGAVAIATSLALAVFAIGHGNAGGVAQLELIAGICAAAAFAVFLITELKVRAPLVPLSVFRRRNLTTATAACIFWAAAIWSWYFIAALYMQHVLRYGPLQVAVAFLPLNVLIAACSLWISAKLVARFGLKLPLCVGLSIGAVGLALFGLLPVATDATSVLILGMVVLGIGAGIAYSPLVLTAMSDLTPEESGLASGIINTAFMMGGAVGVSLAARIASARTEVLMTEGANEIAASTAGYQLAFISGSCCAITAAVLSILFLRFSKAGSQKTESPSNIQTSRESSSAI